MGSYAKVWTLDKDTERQLVKEVRKYVDQQLLKDVPPHRPGEWNRNRTDYTKALHSLSKLKMSLCTATSHTLSFAQFRLTLRSRNRRGDHVFATQEDMNDQVYRAFQQYVKEHNFEISQCRKKFRYLIIYAGLSVKDSVVPRGRFGHATLLVFDMERKHQIYFDPNKGMDSRCLMITQAFLHRPLLPGFKPVPLRETVRKTYGKSIQAAFENDDHYGQCGILCLLVFLCCNRFNYYHLKNMAIILRKAYRDQNARALVSAKMISLHLWVLEQKDRRIPFERIFPKNDTCLSYCTMTNKLCQRPSCKSPESGCRCYCWQHRSLYVNPFGKSVSCKSPIVVRRV